MSPISQRSYKRPAQLAQWRKVSTIEVNEWNSPERASLVAVCNHATIGIKDRRREQHREFSTVSTGAGGNELATLMRNVCPGDNVTSHLRSRPIIVAMRRDGTVSKADQSDPGRSVYK